MLEIGIPVYKARKTLPKALDSMVAQTKQNFIVCLSIDGDGENYEDIIKEYQRRGLKLRVIRAKENGGPGVARQRVLDTTQCDYIMFVDSDDMLMPRAVEVLYGQGKAGNYDMIRSSFIREENNKSDLFMSQNIGTITWFHGKIYKVQYLKQLDLKFLPLRTDEDAYFNLVAWNSTKNRGELGEITYLWRFNENSITRSSKSKEYFIATHMNYITSQVEGLKKLAEYGHGNINPKLVGQTLINIYNYYMRGCFYNIDTTNMDNLISSLSNLPWMQAFLCNLDNWVDIVQTVKAGDIYDSEFVIFFSETIHSWAKRLLFKTYD